MTSFRGLAIVLVALSVHVQCPRAAADGPTPGSFDAGGVKVRYFVQGKGEPVVLVHGLYSSALINWQLPGTSGLLANKHKVIALDMRGHGGSDKPEKEDAYGVEMAEDIVRLLDHLKIKKAHVVGYSMGGMIAVKLMTKHPDRVLSGTLGGMGWFREGSLWQKVFQGAEARSFLRTPGECFRSLGKLAVTEKEIKAIRVPVVVLVGDRDPCKGMYVEPLQKVRKDWPVIEISGAGHLDCIFKKQFKDEIAKWLDRQVKR
jgi:pimeloyl-ACP methyl ester carboxylesterase